MIGWLIPMPPWSGPPLPHGLHISWQLVMPPHLGPPLPRKFGIKWRKKEVKV